MAEASEVANSLPFVTASEFETSVSQHWDPIDASAKPSVLLSLPCTQPEDRVCAQLAFVDDRLVQVELIPNYILSFGEVSAELGEPDSLTVRPVFPEVGNCQVRLVWLALQTTVTYFEYEWTSGRDLCREIADADYRISPDLPVESVIVQMLGSIRSSLAAGEIHEWKGFLE